MLNTTPTIPVRDLRFIRTQADELIRNYITGSGPTTKEPDGIARELIDLGPEAIEAFVGSLKLWHTPDLIRIAISFGRDGRPLVPVLMDMFTQYQKDPWISIEIRNAIIAFGPEAEDAIPTLISAFSNDRSNYCEEASNALAAIGEKAVAPLILCLRKGSDQDQEYALRTFRMLGTTAAAALPILMDMRDTIPQEGLLADCRRGDFESTIHAVRDCLPMQTKYLLSGC